MTIYQELQLSSVGSKQLIRATEDKKEKRRHILIYNFKVYLVMAFCVAVVSLYSSLTGKDNSVVGVTVLLAVLVLRQADFGIRTTHGLGSILGIFTILMTGPRISNLVSPVQVGDGAYIAAGSTVTEDVEADALYIARSRGTQKQGWVSAKGIWNKKSKAQTK